MKYILDMVHHNPGEPRFQSAFLDPAHLADYGYNGQVFKHLNCVATFTASGVDVFPAGSPERAWLDEFTKHISEEIAAAKAQGLKVFYHLDLFVLPKRLVERFRGEICDRQTGRILLDRPKTLELHRVLFGELAARFPQVDGFIVRVGETYLYDTPHHTGNGPIPRLGPNWTPDYGYQELLDQKPATPAWSATQTDAYVKLIRFLRDEICVRHDKILMFRTWDIFPNKLHARPDHYLEVTDRVEPHPNLVFSIKHTALDFWRRVKVNECLTRGRHQQIIEVQCQREYEGKGAYPNYIMEGVINGFEENAQKTGLKDLLANPQIAGVYSWSRGGGWYGPYLPCELWPDLNAYVLGRFVQNPEHSEAEIFRDYAREHLRLKGADIQRFRRLCLLSAQAILKGRYCEAFDLGLNESLLPTALWMRDDRLGGRGQLKLVLDGLFQQKNLDEALQEKAGAVALWQTITELAIEIKWPAGEFAQFARISARYGHRLFSIVHAGWRVLAAGHAGDGTGHYDCQEILAAAETYRTCWREYHALALLPLCPSLYQACYFNLPGMAPVAGLDESVAYYENLARTANGSGRMDPKSGIGRTANSALALILCVGVMLGGVQGKGLAQTDEISPSPAPSKTSVLNSTNGCSKSSGPYATIVNRNIFGLAPPTPPAPPPPRHKIPLATIEFTGFIEMPGEPARAIFTSVPRDPRAKATSFVLAEGEQNSYLELVNIFADQKSARVVIAGETQALALRDGSLPAPAPYAPPVPGPWLNGSRPPLFSR